MRNVSLFPGYNLRNRPTDLLGHHFSSGFSVANCSNFLQKMTFAHETGPVHGRWTHAVDAYDV